MWVVDSGDGPTAASGVCAPFPHLHQPPKQGWGAGSALGLIWDQSRVTVAAARAAQLKQQGDTEQVPSAFSGHCGIAG